MPVSAEGRVENQNEPKRPKLAVWVRFGFQLYSLEKSDPLNAANCVGVLTISFVYIDSVQPLTLSLNSEINLIKVLANSNKLQFSLTDLRTHFFHYST